MVWRTAEIGTGAVALVGTILISSGGAPLQAQTIDNDYSPTDDEISLPEGDESENEPVLYYERNDGSVGEAGLYTGPEPIIIIDGQAYEYDPNDLDNNPILDNLIPLGGTTPDAEVDVTPSTPPEPEMNPEPSSQPGNVESDGMEQDSGGTVTFPPAESVEELEPEDILE